MTTQRNDPTLGRRPGRHRRGPARLGSTVRARAAAVAACALAVAGSAVDVSASAATSTGAPGADRPGSTHNYAIVRTATPGLADHTLLRPADLRQIRYRMPIIVWANGGCRESNMEFNYFLTHFAAYGYFIVANGAPGNPFDATEVTGMVKPAPEKLIAGIDWAVKQNASPSSPFYGRLDTRRIVAMGQSCGGYEALDASASDPRIASTIIWDSGTDPQDPTAVTSLRAPVLYADGGTFDIMDWDANLTYQLSTVPAVFASLSGAGHTGMWDDPAPPAAPPGQYQNEPLFMADKWIAFTLYPSASSAKYFLGANCVACQRPGWSVQAKNWPAAK